MTILAELHQDHVNLNKLLVILRQKVNQLKAGQQPNFSLMADLIDYISNYADGHHHPREDKMYKCLADRNPELDKHLFNCAKDHEALKSSSLQLKEAVHGILHDSVMPMDEFAGLLDDFVSLQMAHLNFEEGQLFPMIQEVVSDKELAMIEKQLPKQEDPLFGEVQAREYTALYKELMLEMNEAC
ncbi:hemerythrin domain-containing protein [Neptuniibacter sp. PT8_73]|uniref:hemerythrin domain-containing protein n=1 Tax=unclassified Neptuniibacter TaxID=2630693 RepID=UPI0039F48F28